MRGAARESPLKVHLGAFLQPPQAGGSQGLLDDIKAEAVPVLGGDLWHKEQPVNTVSLTVWAMSCSTRTIPCTQSRSQCGDLHGGTATAMGFIARQVSKLATAACTCFPFRT